MAYKEYDVFVIGTGTAGKNVAKACAKAGQKVAIADNREYGGTCANRGCDPKKVLVGLAEVIDRSHKMLGKGITEMPKVSWEDIQEFKKKFVDKVPAATEEDLKELEIEMYHQSPKFIDENTLSVEGKTIKAKKIVIATGNKPLELNLPGSEHLLVSDDFLSLKKLPESMIFIGAGYIGMEFAHIAARMGVKVTMIDMESRPLNNFEEAVVNPLVEVSKDLGIEFITDASVNEIEKLRKNFRVSAKKGSETLEVKAELVFNTAGRVPSIDQLDLKKGNVSFTKKGISVNKFLQNPSNKNVFACGDVSDSEGLPLTPLSSQESKVVFSHLTEENIKEEATYPPQPSVVFTLPQIASVGLTEEQAREKGYDVIIEEKTDLNWFNAKRINERHYGYKTIVDKKTDLILGAHIISPEAGEMINLFVMAICGELTRYDLKKMIFAYPTWGNDIKGMI
ncbi:NAD(P)/FAD-dependent oxidoreductase [Mesonia sp. K4-1]|uniref:dihydrolipoyl dehydrogenase family protein n=1 Tax=Mesonia sp. K4-1 TaxID=2602760 RepID=UPI0011C8A35D|nr:NAD(P)/FAD-dependent oxidoreductase [Mesonia sp. K4-1]TXK78801.1 NAD(P)/FAD-dependent oxidoreductase [Mesonia sp. K4-1]